MDNLVNGLSAMSVNLNINLSELPECPDCPGVRLLPFPDEAKDSKMAMLKAWVCPKCGKGVIIRSGTLSRVFLDPENMPGSRL